MILLPPIELTWVPTHQVDQRSCKEEHASTSAEKTTRMYCNFRAENRKTFKTPKKLTTSLLITTLHTLTSDALKERLLYGIENFVVYLKLKRNVYDSFAANLANTIASTSCRSNELQKKRMLQYLEKWYSDVWNSRVKTWKKLKIPKKLTTSFIARLQRLTHDPPKERLLYAIENFMVYLIPREKIIWLSCYQLSWHECRHIRSNEGAAKKTAKKTILRHLLQRWSLQFQNRNLKEAFNSKEVDDILNYHITNTYKWPTTKKRSAPESSP